MDYRLEDIQFNNISWSDFEEMIFDLIRSMGFINVEWKKGGSDRGRDIEAKLKVIRPLVGEIEEVFFIECKHYEKGIPPKVLNANFAWADAESPNHLIIVTNSHITNEGGRWLKKMNTKKEYNIKVISGDELKRILIHYPPIIDNYFLLNQERDISAIKRKWCFHNIPPNVVDLYVLCKILKN